MKTPPLQQVCDCSGPNLRSRQTQHSQSCGEGRMGIPSGYQNGEGRNEQEVALYQAGTLLTTIFIICIGRAAGTILRLEALVT